MKIKQRFEEGIAILSLDGRLTIGEGDVALREEVRKILDEGQKKIILDLDGVRRMDSSGLGELVRAKTSSEGAGAKIKLLNVEKKVQSILSMTRLIGLFDTFEDEIDAVASFR